MSQNLNAAGEAFLAHWQSQYPGSFPVSHSLKWRFPKRWVRFHSLPDGQLYAANNAQSDAILMRQNTIMKALLPIGQRIEIVFSNLEPECHLFQSCDLTPLGAFPDEAAEMPVQTWWMQDVWEMGGLDIPLLLVAGDQARMIIMGPDCLIAPYDGGVDVIASDAFTAHALKRQFQAWVSPREDGL
jgi:hypothetical protein